MYFNVIGDPNEWLIDIVGYIAGADTLPSIANYRFVAVLEGTGVNRSISVSFNNQSANSVQLSLTVEKKVRPCINQTLTNYLSWI